MEDRNTYRRTNPHASDREADGSVTEAGERSEGRREEGLVG